MDFAWNEEQEALRETARSFLAEHAGSEALRRAMESEPGYDPALWKQLGAELGWTALIVPEGYGGLGLGFVELVALQEVMGEALLCAPYFSTVCLAANALLVAGSEAQKAEHLPGIAAGETLATLAWTEPSGAPGVSHIETIARPDGGDFVLRGRKRFVPDGHCADLVIVAARNGGVLAGAAAAKVLARDHNVPILNLPGKFRIHALEAVRGQAFGIESDEVFRRDNHICINVISQNPGVSFQYSSHKNCLRFRPVSRSGLGPPWPRQSRD